MGLVRRCVDDYNMIEDGDRIAVGISGGKDSLTLLYALKELRRFYPAEYDLMAVSVDLGFENIDFTGVADYCRGLGIPYHIIKTDIAQIVFEQRKEHSPCSLCAKMRKGAFNDFARENGFNKSAFGHHKDDLVNTMLMSLIYEGRLNTFSPVTVLDRSGITLIRPLLYVAEEDIKGFVNKYQIRPFKNPCPVDGITKRQYVADLLKDINKEAPGVRDRMFTAIVNGIVNK